MRPLSSRTLAASRAIVAKFETVSTVQPSSSQDSSGDAVELLGDLADRLDVRDERRAALEQRRELGDHPNHLVRGVLAAGPAGTVEVDGGIDLDVRPLAADVREAEPVERLGLAVLSRHALGQLVGDLLVEGREQDLLRHRGVVDGLDDGGRLARAGAGADDEVAAAGGEVLEDGLLLSGPDFVRHAHRECSRHANISTRRTTKKGPPAAGAPWFERHTVVWLERH